MRNFVEKRIASLSPWDLPQDQMMAEQAMMQAAQPMPQAMQTTQPPIMPPRTQVMPQSMRMAQQPMAMNEPQKNNQPIDYEGEIIRMMKERQGGIQGMQKQLADLQANPSSPWAKVDLRPLAQGIDAITGSKMSYNMAAPQDVRGEQVKNLEQKIAQQQNALGDDQLNYFKSQMQDQAMTKRLEAQDRMFNQRLQAQSGRQDMGQEKDLRNFWSNDPITKETKTISNAYEKIQQSYNSNSPGSDLSLIYGLMKLEDPNSTVRESEAEMAQGVGGFGQKTRALWDFYVGQGRKLTPQQRQAITGEAQIIYNAQKERQNQFDATVSDLAQRKGADSQNIVLKKMFERPNVQLPQQSSGPLSPQDWLKQRRVQK